MIMYIKAHKKLCLIFMSIIIILFNILPVSFADTTPSVYSPSCILMDAKSGKILFSKKAEEKMYPASTTKVMTAILALEHCQLTDIATVSHNAIFSIPYGYSIADLKEGEQLTIEQLLYVLLIPSANDAAFVLAEHIGGSVEQFSDMMNKKAAELGCKNTHFVNPNGIHDENHYSTAYDLALIGQYAMKFDFFRKVVSTTIYTLPGTAAHPEADRIFGTTNDLIKNSGAAKKYYYQYATGAKTGYTEAAKNCIIATAQKDDVELIAVVLHDEQTPEGLSTRPIDCKTLFEYGFNNYASQTIATAGTVEKTINVSGASADTRHLNLVLNKDVVGLNPTDYDLSDVVVTIDINQDIKAPISKDTVLGKITFNADGYEYSANLIAANDVKAFDLKKVLLELVAIIVVLKLFSSVIKSKRKRKKKKSKKRNSSSQCIHSDFYPTYKIK